MLFMCQHHTPDVVWREDYLHQPNDALGIAEVIGIADDLGRIEDAYRVMLGDRVRRTDDRVAITAGNALITFLSPTAFAERFGVLGGRSATRDPPCGLTFSGAYVRRDRAGAAAERCAVGARLRAKLAGSARRGLRHAVRVRALANRKAAQLAWASSLPNAASSSLCTRTRSILAAPESGISSTSRMRRGWA